MSEEKRTKLTSAGSSSSSSNSNSNSNSNRLGQWSAAPVVSGVTPATGLSGQTLSAGSCVTAGVSFTDRSKSCGGYHAGVSHTSQQSTSVHQATVQQHQPVVSVCPSPHSAGSGAAVTHTSHAGKHSLAVHQATVQQHQPVASTTVSALTDTDKAGTDMCHQSGSRQLQGELSKQISSDVISCVLGGGGINKTGGGGSDQARGLTMQGQDHQQTTLTVVSTGFDSRCDKPTGKATADMPPFSLSASSGKGETGRCRSATSDCEVAETGRCSSKSTADDGEVVLAPMASQGSRVETDVNKIQQMSKETNKIFTKSGM